MVSETGWLSLACSEEQVSTRPRPEEPRNTGSKASSGPIAQPHPATNRQESPNLLWFLYLRILAIFHLLTAPAGGCPGAGQPSPASWAPPFSWIVGFERPKMMKALFPVSRVFLEL